VIDALLSNWLENLAVAFGLISVYLSTREKISSWPTAIVNVGIFFFVFWKAKLYADAVLQIVYLALSFYGWYEWLFGGAQKTRLQVSRARARDWAILLPLCALFAFGLGTFLSRHTDSPVPYLDASLTSASLVAQWMMTRKQLENWVVWIVADIVYVPTFLARHLPSTAVQYAVFLVLAVMGYVSWRKSLASHMIAAEPAAA
jgi:nicotinamide mononucleotide transporter